MECGVWDGGKEDGRWSTAEGGGGGKGYNSLCAVCAPPAVQVIIGEWREGGGGTMHRAGGAGATGSPPRPSNTSARLGPRTWPQPAGQRLQACRFQRGRVQAVGQRGLGGASKGGEGKQGGGSKQGGTLEAGSKAGGRVKGRAPQPRGAKARGRGGDSAPCQACSAPRLCTAHPLCRPPAPPRTHTRAPQSASAGGPHRPSRWCWTRS